MAQAPGAAVGTTRADDVVVSRFLQLEAMEQGAVTLFLSHDGSRVRIPSALYAVLLRFEVPQRIDDVVAGHPQAVKLGQALVGLQAKGFLHAADQPQLSGPARRLTDPPQRMFDMPAFKPGITVADVVIIGVPSDSGDWACAGARAAPLALREASLHLLYGVDHRTGKARGWYDADQHRPLLQGVAMADAGDIFVDPGEDRQAIFGRMEQVLADIGPALPVLVGGDSTACWPVLSRHAASAPVCVVRIGGPPPRAPRTGAMVSSATLLPRALQLPGVGRTVQVAASPGADHWCHPDHRDVSAVVLREEGAAHVVEGIRAGQPVHVGVDLGVLGSPDGKADADRLTYMEVVDLIHSIGRRCPIVGIDLTGMMPAREGWGVVASTALPLLVQLIDAACSGAAVEGERHVA